MTHRIARTVAVLAARDSSRRSTGASGGVVEHQTGWPATIVALAASAVLILLSALVLARRSGRRMLLLPLLVAAVSWTLIFWNAR